MRTTSIVVALSCWLLLAPPAPRAQGSGLDRSMSWDQIAAMPDSPGVAGAFIGVSGGALIVAGGANFSAPVWESDKQWHDRIHVLVRDGERFAWRDGGRLPRESAYGASVSVEAGVLCIGGTDGTTNFADVLLLECDASTGEVRVEALPSLPRPCAYGAATAVGTKIYVASGQRGSTLDTARTSLWMLDLADRSDVASFAWRELPAFPGRSRAFHLFTSQHNGYEDCLYLVSGRCVDGAGVRFLEDVWEYAPRARSWRRRRDAPRCVMAGTAHAWGQSHIFVLGGADGRLFGRADELRDAHPGFPREALVYHTITDTWVSGGATPVNQVTTTAVRWGGAIVVPSGEVRPRVRTPLVWRIRAKASGHDFGAINYLVLCAYLLGIVAVGVWCARKNKSTNDYFRGGMKIPWWAAGCSIFATMLSSLTFTGIPSKAFAQDWVYALGNFTIPIVAIVAVYLALPFYRRIDATSAYEYFEKRFGRSVRLFASASFALFHVFRMALVMSLTGLALSVATTLTPGQSVLLIGALSVLYSTIGGVEAVIWTDTIQAIVLLCGAGLAIVLLVAGTDGGVDGLFAIATAEDKFRIANFNLDVSTAQIAFWAIAIGAIGQNFSSYTADQAVVQRYMTTRDEKTARRAIWTNAVLSIPATLLFFGIGTALFAYYQSHPDRLDPTITTDQVFPLFIAREMPIGLAGLIVAGIFAAAQSTVSTSMNSTSTVVVTDFLRPYAICKRESGYLRAAKILTLAVGVCGTLLGLVFVDPDIKSLFDAFIMTIGMFMGVLGGLFALGALTSRANARGAMAGALGGALIMLVLWQFTAIHGYVYTTCGIVCCFAIGYAVSVIAPGPARDLTGLTIHSVKRGTA